MGPYSHFILATKLEHSLQPESPGDYYWGSIVPDIRYLAKLQRDRTHLKQETLTQLSEKHPHLKSFLLGYQVHCLIDQIDVSQAMNGVFPLNVLQNLLRKNLSRQQMTMLVEMYYLQSVVPQVEMAGKHNEVLANLGITPDQTGVFFQAMQEYLHSHSVDGAVSAFQKIGMIEDDRVEKYLSAFHSIKKKKLLKAFFMLSIRTARLDQRFIHHVQSAVSRSN